MPIFISTAFSWLWDNPIARFCAGVVLFILGIKLAEEMVRRDERKRIRRKSEMTIREIRENSHDEIDTADRIRERVNAERVRLEPWNYRTD